MKEMAVYFALLVGSCLISFFTTAGLLWLIMTGLTYFGVPLPIEWSWGFSAISWLIVHSIRLLFK